MKYVLPFLIVSFSLATTLTAATTPPKLSGQVIVDGSSTVFPISEAVGEEFQKANRGVKVAVASSGTGGGFKKFCKGELDITGASRPIETNEIAECTKAKIDYVELPVAYDGIAIVTNPQNTWAKTLTVVELKKIWAPTAEGSKPLTKWSEVRAGFPEEKIVLFGPGHDSGTFDYFTKAIVGKEKSSRADFTASEDDNTLVKGVSGQKGALGYFGFAYYQNNQKSLSLVNVDAGKGPVTATPETIANGTYQPLSRPIFIYVSSKALARPEVDAFAKFYIDQAKVLVGEAAYVALGDTLYSSIKKRLEARTLGTLYSGEGVKPGSSLEAVLSSKTPKTK